jgi:putative acetyltransferase
VEEREMSSGLRVALLSRSTWLASPAFLAITEAREEDLPRLFDVWESSVRATHSFLAETDIQALAPLVRCELADFRPIYCLRDSDGKPSAFIGVAGSFIEMLFVHADRRGRGAGRLLCEFAIDVLLADRVDVNEQNEAAVGFYRRLGFERVGRSPLDAGGRPFPLLHLARR